MAAIDYQKTAFILHLANMLYLLGVISVYDWQTFIRRVWDMTNEDV